MDAKIRMDSLRNVGVEYQFTTKLKTGVDTISLVLKMLSNNCYLFFPFRTAATISKAHNTGPTSIVAEECVGNVDSLSKLRVSLCFIVSGCTL